MNCDIGLNRPLKVMMVDDNEEVLRVFSSMVTMLGYGVTSFTSAIDAIEYIKGSLKEIDLIITDYRMPEMNGLDLLIKVRMSGVDIPSIILTGYPEEVDSERARHCGAAIIGKPIRLSELQHQISMLSYNY